MAVAPPPPPSISGLSLTTLAKGAGKSSTQVRFDLDPLEFDERLVLQLADGPVPSGSLIRARLAGADDTWLRTGPDPPFTVRLMAQATWWIGVDPAAPVLVAPTADEPVAQVYVPGTTAGHTANRFIFKVAGESAPKANDRTRCAFGPAGLDLTAAPTDDDVTLDDGGRRRRSVAPQADAGRDPGGRPADRRPGRLRAHGGGRGRSAILPRRHAFLHSSGASQGAVPEQPGATPSYGALSFQLTPNLERIWIDASGLLQLSAPQVWLRLLWKSAPSASRRCAPRFLPPRPAP